MCTFRFSDKCFSTLMMDILSFYDGYIRIRVLPQRDTSVHLHPLSIATYHMQAYRGAIATVVMINPLDHLAVYHSADIYRQTNHTHTHTQKTSLTVVTPIDH